MTRALWIKEWMQLRLLRWTGIGLGLLLPPAVIALTEAAKRGWLPTGAVSDYQVEDLFGSPMGVLYASLWGLLTLLTVTQAFSADRGAGTDTFLLERPVSRRWLWGVKIVAALTSSLLIVIAQLASWALLRQIVVGYGFDAWVGHAVWFSRIGIAGCVLTFCAGLAAAPLLRSPMQVTLLGLVLSALPFGLGALLVNISPMAHVGPVAAGLAVIPLLPLFYIGASWFGECTGEPFGRGRAWRAGRWLITGAVAAIALFVVLVPITMRAQAGGTWRYQIADNEIAVRFVGYRGGAWWRNEATGDKRLFAPPVDGASISADGEWVAILSRARAFGGVREFPRVRIIDSEGRDAFDPIECDDCISDSMRWLDGDLVLPYGPAFGRFAGFLRVSPENGDHVRLPLSQTVSGGNPLGFDSQRRLQTIYCGPVRTPVRDAPTVIDLTVDLSDSERNEACDLLAFTFRETNSEVEVIARFLSDPTWRGYLFRAVRHNRRYHRTVANEGSSNFLDLETGEVIELPGERRSMIELAGNHVALLGPERVQILGPDGESVADRSWPGMGVFTRRSPDGDRVLFQVHSRVAGDWGRKGIWLFDVAERSWQRIEELDRPDFDGALYWAGPSHLYAGANLWSAVYNVDEDRWFALDGKLPWVP